MAIKLLYVSTKIEESYETHIFCRI